MRDEESAMLMRAFIVFAALSLGSSVTIAAQNRAEALNCLKSCRKSCTEHEEAKKPTQNPKELIDCMKVCHSDQCMKKK
jgi:hypothetical protein